MVGALVDGPTEQLARHNSDNLKLSNAFHGNSVVGSIELVVKLWAKGNDLSHVSNESRAIILLLSVCTAQ